jgi:hypothetical protein
MNCKSVGLILLEAYAHSYSLKNNLIMCILASYKSIITYEIHKCMKRKDKIDDFLVVMAIADFLGS